MNIEHKRPLSWYILAVVIVWALILLGFAHYDPARLHIVEAVCSGFFIGMLAMYIAVHVYRWK